jgi:hypothetical protein
MSRVRASASPSAQPVASGLRSRSERIGRWVDARRTPRRDAFAALAIFAFAAIVAVGREMVTDPAHTTIGNAGSDRTQWMWSFEWVIHALRHLTNPFITHVTFAPVGFNLAWATVSPSAAILAIPITLLFGPVVSWNVVMLAAPISAAWLMFLVCRRLTRAFAPSLVGGFLFGFSSYEIGTLAGHLHLAVVCAIPLALYLVIRRLQGDLGTVAFVITLGLTLAFQFGISTEVFLTMTLAGAVAGASLLAFAPSRMEVLRRDGPPVVLAYALCAILVAPYLWYAFRYGSPQVALQPPAMYSTDALNFVVPTVITRIGRTTFGPVAATFTGNAAEQGGYLGVPLIVIMAAFAVERWREWLTRALVVTAGILVALTLGPVLHIAGISTMRLPWEPLTHVPLVKHVLPGRLMVYVAAVAAVMAALWIARRGGWWRWGLVVLALVALVPNWSSPLRVSSIETPSFFSSSLYRHYLKPDDNVLVLPFGSNGNSMLWQAKADFGFRMAGGYFSYLPAPFSTDPFVLSAGTGAVPADGGKSLRHFLKAFGVTAIVVDPAAGPQWAGAFAQAHVHAVFAGGVEVARLPGR